MVHLLRELRRHGIGHKWWGVLLRSLCLGKREWGMSCTSLCTVLTGSKLLGLEVVLAWEGSCLVEVGLSIIVVAASAEAIAATITAPIATIL